MPFDALLTTAPLPLPALAVCMVAVLSAYVVFGMAGFGTALVAGPVLALYLPLATVVPVLAVLDCVAACVAVARGGRSASGAELKRLVPAMMCGSLLGAALLLHGRPALLQAALGLFAVAYAGHALSGRQPAAALPPWAAWPFGAVGGVFSALFGAGGFLYAIYLSNRALAPAVQRVSQSVLIGSSTMTRVVLFLAAGVYADAAVWGLALWLAPAMLAGRALGQRLTVGLSRARFLRVVNGLVLLSGLVLLGRYGLAGASS